MFNVIRKLFGCAECDYKEIEKSSLLEENKNLKEALYGPRDMTRNETLEHFASRMADEKDYWETLARNLRTEVSNLKQKLEKALKKEE